MHPITYKIDNLNENLLCSMGNSIQYSVMDNMGKESKKRLDMCKCVSGSICYRAEISATL